MYQRHEDLLRFATLAAIVSFTVVACEPAQPPTPTVKPETPTFTPLPPTETRTPTPAPTSTPTPTPLQGDLDTYYPYGENKVWWYSYSLGGEFVRPSSFSFIGMTTLENGTEAYQLQNEESGFQQIDYLEILDGSVLLHRNLMDPKDGEPESIDYDPPIPILRFPLEVGKSWRYDPFTYIVSALESVSVPMGDFENCFVVDMSSDDVVYMTNWYCPEVGRVMFEHLTETNLARLELAFKTTARVEVAEVKQSGESCYYNLRLLGFDDMEPMTFTVELPTGEELIQAEDLPVSENFLFAYPIHPHDPTGLWIFQIAGTDHNAIHAFIWDGECR
jgi:hypothetical protein